MCDYIRGVPFHVEDTAQAVHFRDIRDALKTLSDEESPTALCICGDNGSGYDPTDPVNQHYAGELLRDFPKLKVIFLISYAAGGSSMNVLVERPWSQHKKSVVGLRLGLDTFLGGVRRAPTSEEMLPFFECVGQELKEVWEDTINIAEDNETITAPTVEFVGPLSKTEEEEAQRIQKFFMSHTVKQVHDPKNADLLKKAKSDNKRTFQTFNSTCVVSEDCDQERLFGPTKRPLMPERFQAEGRTHYASYPQKVEKYKRVAQKDYVMTATRGREKVYRCCNRVMLIAAAMKRHCVLIHRDKKPVSKRKRPTRVAFKRRVVRRKAATSPRAETDDDKSSDDKSSEEEEELEEDKLEEELQTVEMATMVNEEGSEDSEIAEGSEDSESAEDCEDAQDAKYKHCSIIGTIALTGGEQSEFFIRYPKSSCEDAGEDWTSINSE